MDVAVIYNFAEYPGGGDLVALDIIEALLEKDLTVNLYTSLPEGIQKAIHYFDKNSRIFKNVAIRKVETPKMVKHPYNIYLITKKTLNELKEHDLIIFFDDIPKPALKLRKVLVYVHYPHAARMLLNELVPYRYKYTFKGKLLWKTHCVLFRRYFLMNWNKPNIHVIANSTLTYSHVARALKPRYLAKVYPPVQVKQIIEFIRRANVAEDNIVVYVGRIQPEKGVEDLIKAVAMLKNADVKVRILGFNFDINYLQYLRKLVEKLGVAKQVSIEVNVPRKRILEILAKAKSVVHPAHYEPFGIAVVEGMAAGCIPIVRKGFNGPWIDIVKKGRYGYGYECIFELAKIIGQLIIEKKGTIMHPNDLMARSLEFSEFMFKRRVLELLKTLV